MSGCPIHGGYHGGYCEDFVQVMESFRWWKPWLWWAWPEIKKGLRNGTVIRR